VTNVLSNDEIAGNLISQGWSLQTSGRLEDAFHLFMAAIILAPKHRFAYKARGDWYAQCARHQQAIEDYDRALELAPKFAGALYNRAVMKKALGRMSDAMADLNTVLQIDGGFVGAYLLRGDLHIEARDFQMACEDFEAALRLEPTSQDAKRRLGKAELLKNDGQSNRGSIFEYVYNSGFWGKFGNPADPYMSGTGTRNQAHYEKYVAAVGEFLAGQSEKLRAVDVGCGDFFIGSKIREFCSDYVACDVVEGLIAYNRSKFKDLGVDFRVLDAVTDPLPDGDIVFIREVLQHLSNSDILGIISKLNDTYKYAVITESLPSQDDFVPNLDKVTSDKIRVNVNGSGVVLTKAPFNLPFQKARELCVSPDGRNKIVTTLYIF
jgi:tetratricopeptide (TPR) repeat protein